MKRLLCHLGVHQPSLVADNARYETFIANRIRLECSSCYVVLGNEIGWREDVKKVVQ